jgi:hypothetical protein
MSLRILCRLVAFWLVAIVVLSSCASTKSTAQTDPNSMLQAPQSNYETHGEVSVMYGHSF